MKPYPALSLIRFAAALLAGLLLHLPLHAQSANTGVVQGRVLNESTGDYVNSAAVTVAGTNLRTLTDTSGWYLLSGVPAGVVELRVTHATTVDRTLQATVTPGATLTLDIPLKSVATRGVAGEDVVVLSAFDVTAQRELDAAAIAINDQRHSASIKNVVSTDEFGDVTEGNVGDFAKFLPGITIDYTGTDARTISVRGVGPSFTQVTLDGAQLASANSSNPGRQFELEQVSINNTSRIEVFKSRTPDIAANALGGAVNLVSRSAFERRDPSLTYRAFLSLNGDADKSLKKSPGPSENRTRKIRPGGDFVWIHPVSQNFGYTVSVLHSDVFNQQDYGNPLWSPHAQTRAGATPSEPYLSNYNNRAGPKETQRQSIGTTLDWRVTPADVISFNVQWNAYDAFFANRQNSFDQSATAVAPQAYSPTFTHGAPGTGQVTMIHQQVDKYGKTYSGDLRWKHTGQIWRMDAGVAHSHATNYYKDTDFGHFERINVRLRGQPKSTLYNNYRPTVRYEDIDGFPNRIVVLDGATGEPIDLSDPSNYNVLSAGPTDAESFDQFTTARFNIGRDLGLSFPLSIKAGGLVQKQVRDIRRNAGGNLDFVGPDRTPNSADDNYALYDLIDEDFFTTYPFNGPRMPTPSPSKFYRLYQEHPEYFRDTNPQNLIINTVNNSRRFEETISAAYLMADARLFAEKLRVVTGVRFERTDDEGWGALINPAVGKDITDPVERAKVQYIERGFHRKNSYDDIYPSVDLAWEIRDSLILRAAYAKSIGRPDLNYILPSVNVPDITVSNSKVITVTNSALLPATADNLDLSLEYYFRKTGVVSVGVFRKDFKNFNGSAPDLEATDELLEQFNVPNPELYNDGTFVIRTRQNVGDAVVEGIEFNYRQVLDFEGLPQWARNFTVFANGQQLDMSGSDYADFTNFIRRTVSWGIKYSARKFTAQVNVNHRGLQRLGVSAAAAGPNVWQYRSPRDLVDANFEYRIRPAVSVFVNVRNLLNDPLEVLHYGDETPDYAKLRSQEVFGAAWTFGVKGRF